MQTMINVEVVKGTNENNLSAIRRFTKRVQSAGILSKVRSKRYAQQLPSRNVRRAKHLNFLKKKEVTAELIKLGKLNEVSKFTRRR